MAPLELVGLLPLMALTSGSSEVVIGLIDGPVATRHPAFASSSISELGARRGGQLTESSGTASQHATFVAGMLVTTRRDEVAPAICPDCRLLVRPIFDDALADGPAIPSATPQQLATALVECVDAGARVLNLSLDPPKHQRT